MTSFGISDGITIIFSTLALSLSMLSFIRSQVAARAQTFKELRSEFARIKEKLPSWYAGEDFSENNPYDFDSSEWRPIEVYWQHSFDEWFITQKVDKQALGRLWSLYYEDTIGKALEIKALRLSISQITHLKSEFGPYNDEYREVLNSIWRKNSPERRNICDGFECSFPHPERNS